MHVRGSAKARRRTWPRMHTASRQASRVSTYQHAGVIFLTVKQRRHNLKRHFYGLTAKPLPYSSSAGTQRDRPLRRLCVTTHTVCTHMHLIPWYPVRMRIRKLLDIHHAFNTFT
eukprot:126092-Pelagomonas_calceolata.AAC.4